MLLHADSLLPLKMGAERFAVGGSGICCVLRGRGICFRRLPDAHVLVGAKHNIVILPPLTATTDDLRNVQHNCPVSPCMLICTSRIDVKDPYAVTRCPTSPSGELEPRVGDREHGVLMFTQHEGGPTGGRPLRRGSLAAFAEQL